MYSSDGNYSGGICGLDSNGDYGERITIKFSGGNISRVDEQCAILSGNTGAYLENNRVSGTYAVGGVYISSQDPASQMTAIDINVGGVFYTSFNITNDVLKLGIPFQSYDGSTPDKRAFQTAMFYDPATKKMTAPPLFRRM